MTCASASLAKMYPVDTWSLYQQPPHSDGRAKQDCHHTSVLQRGQDTLIYY